jgi:hypothetical protein
MTHELNTHIRIKHQKHNEFGSMVNNELGLLGRGWGGGLIRMMGHGGLELGDVRVCARACTCGCEGLSLFLGVTHSYLSY